MTKQRFNLLKICYHLDHAFPICGFTLRDGLSLRPNEDCPSAIPINNELLAYSVIIIHFSSKAIII